MPSYYQIIDGKKYDRRLLENAKRLTEGRGDGRISQKDAENLLPSIQDGMGITAIEKESLLYLLAHLKWTDKAAAWMKEQIDRNPEREEENSAETIIRKEFRLHRLHYRIADHDVVEQEELPNNAVPFPEALRLALNVMLTSNSHRDSPRYLIMNTFGLFPDRDPAAEEKISEKLREFLQEGELRLLPKVDWNDENTEFDFVPPIDRESAEKYWVFSLYLYSLSDHVYWMIVARDGLGEPYVYGYN